MKYKTLIFVTILFSLSACDKNQNTNLDGLYSESSPVSNRTQIDFISNSKLVIIKGASNRDTFNYKIENKTISLNHIMFDYTSELNFDLISDTRFSIENLYASIPESDITYMTFDKMYND